MAATAWKNGGKQDGTQCPRQHRALTWLFDRINYERTSHVPYHFSDLKLDRMRHLLALIGNPHGDLKVVHVAGTKGKGSSATMIASVLSQAGYRTGLYTSPHLNQLQERMVVNGQPCSAEDLVGLIEYIQPAVEEIDNGCFSGNGPTYFEISTAISLLYFTNEQVDIAVLEVGMGGRLDATNVCYPVVSMITNISFDHVKELGETLGEIATEKAGIIKPGIPVICGVTDKHVSHIIAQIARKDGCRFLQLSQDFNYRYHPPHSLQTKKHMGMIDFHLATGDLQSRYSRLQLNLLGQHQAANASLVLAALTELRRQGWDVPETAIRKGLVQTPLSARVEIVQRSPIVIVDTAHNTASVEALVQTLRQSFQARNYILIFSATQEKDLRGMLQVLLPNFQHIILTRYLNNPRAASANGLDRIASCINSTPRHVFEKPDDAWAYARRIAKPEDLVCITGSFFIAAEMRRLVVERPLG